MECGNLNLIKAVPVQWNGDRGSGGRVALKDSHAFGFAKQKQGLQSAVLILSSIILIGKSYLYVIIYNIIIISIYMHP